MLFFYRVETEQQKTEVQIKLEQTHTPSRTPVCGEVDYRAAWYWHAIRQITRFLCHLDMFTLSVCTTVEPETREIFLYRDTRLS